MGRLSPALIERLAAVVGRERALTDPDPQLRYLREWRDLYEGRAGVGLQMRAGKAAFDPKGIFDPGKVLRGEGAGRAGPARP